MAAASSSSATTSTYQMDHQVPRWHYLGPDPTQHQQLAGENVFTFPPLEGPNAVDVGTYVREIVTNVDMHETGRRYFNLGLRLMLSYQHEMASKCFLAALHFSPHCALAHGLVALCHSPNYNFKGEAYYESTGHVEDAGKHDLLCVFPSQQVADRHSKFAIEKVEELRRMHRSSSGGGHHGHGGRRGKGKKGKKGGQQAKHAKVESPSSSGEQQPHSNNGGGAGGGGNNGDNKQQQQQQQQPIMIADVEVQLLTAIRTLTCCPGVDPGLSIETVGRPYADAMRKVYEKYPNDPEVAYCFAESLMVLNAWQLYEYPSGKPVSPDVEETRGVLELALQTHPKHAGLCHMYVHLSEMSAHPELALRVCPPLRDHFPHAGHLIHMPTHIDVLVGDYEACVKYNHAAIKADTYVMEKSPASAGKESFYFGYIVHNYHMAVYGAILGGMEGKAMELAEELNTIVNETMFNEFRDLVSYLESYSALDVHVMIRFGRWEGLLRMELPRNKKLMLYRAASIRFARGLAYAATGDTVEARKEAGLFDSLRHEPDAQERILHNNTVAALLAVDATMMRGEICYREGNYEEAFKLLRKAVHMQDNLNYDEPWGKMQPIRHALGGLLLEQGQVEEAEGCFRRDLFFHPKNPWALVGLIGCLRKGGGGGGSKNGDNTTNGGGSSSSPSCCSSSEEAEAEIAELTRQLEEQRKTQWADFNVTVACECCRRPPPEEMINGQR